MRRSWLVLAVLCGGVGMAEAKRIACACPARVVVPERGATDVPINAKIWILDHGKVQTFEPTLAPSMPHQDDQLGVSFIAGAYADTTPPQAPRGVHVELSSNGSQLHGASLFGDYDVDTALIRVELRGPGGSATLVTTPRRLYLCNTGIYVPGSPTATITAIDVAGNESAPFETTAVNTFLAQQDGDLCGDDRLFADPHRHRGHGFEYLFGFFLYVVWLIAWLVIALVRRATALRAPAEQLSLLVAEEVARRELRWQVVWNAMLIAGLIGLLAANSPVLAFCVAPLALVALGKLFIARDVLGAIERPEATAVRHGRWLAITTLRGPRLLRASDADFIAARRSSIPRSVAR